MHPLCAAVKSTLVSCNAWRHTYNVTDNMAPCPDPYVPYVALNGVNNLCTKAGLNLDISKFNVGAAHLVSGELLTEAAFSAQVSTVYSTEWNALVRVSHCARRVVRGARRQDSRGVATAVCVRHSISRWWRANLRTRWSGRTRPGCLGRTRLGGS